MKDILTREEFAEMHISIAEGVREALLEQHGLNIDTEIERIVDQEYAEYLKFVETTQPDILPPPELDDFI